MKNKMVVTLSTIGVITVAAITGGMLYINHQKYTNTNNFPAKTTINGVNVGGIPVSETYSLLQKDLSTQKVYIYENSDDDSPKYTLNKAGKNSYSLTKAELKTMLKKSRSKYPTLKFTLKKTSSKYKQYVSDKLAALDINKNRTKGVQSTITKDADKFSVSKETSPNYVDTDALVSRVKSKKVTDDKDTNSYFLSDFYSKFDSNYLGNKKLTEIADNYNKYLRTISVEKTDISPKTDMSASTIFDALDLNNNNLTVNSDKITSWVNDNMSKYNKLTSYGDTIKSPDGVSHAYDLGQHGTTLDTMQLISDLSKEIMSSDNDSSVTPIAKKVDDKKSIDYVAINLSTLHEYVVKDGKTVVSTPVMSGKTGSNATPTGTFKIAFKQSPAVLRGSNDDGSAYASPVNYWEPFNGGVGLHDSPWQPSSVYGNPSLRSAYGSHGCINNPPSVMPQVYANTFTGETVYVY